MLKFIKILAIVWLPLILGNQAIIAKQRTAELKSLYKVDVCSSNKDIIVTIDIDTVYRADSLYAFDLEMQTDSLKVKFEQGLFLTGTLSSFFEYKTARFYNDGKSVIQAGQINPSLPPVSGIQPLTGAFGKFIYNCPDTSIANLNYIGFNTEFKDTIAEIIPALIIGYVTDKPERKIKTGTASDSLIFEPDTILRSFIIDIDSYIDSRIESFDLNIGGIDSKYSIDTVESLSGIVEIEGIKYSTVDDTLRTGASLSLKANAQMTGLPALTVTLREIEKDTNVQKINISISNINKCACITRFENDSLYIKGIAKAEDTTGIEEYKDYGISCYYDRKNVKYVVNAEKTKVLKALVYDFTGSLKETRQNSSYDTRIEIDATSYPAGAYIILMQLQNSKTERVILIKD